MDYLDLIGDEEADRRAESDSQRVPQHASGDETWTGDVPAVWPRDARRVRSGRLQSRHLARNMRRLFVCSAEAAEEIRSIMMQRHIDEND